MTNSNDNADTLFSVSLLDNVQKHLLFLNKAHSCGISLQQNFPSLESLRRYEQLWLPLVLNNPYAHLIPPADIAWIWHCHRLAPKSYESYIQKAFGKTPPLEASMPFTLQTKEDLNSPPLAAYTRTIEIWNTNYPTEEFFYDQNNNDEGGSGSSIISEILQKNSSDLIASCQSQAKFLWQVSSPNYNDIEFLKDGIENYYKFLKLSSTMDKNKQVIIVPTLQIDLIWHTHILSNLELYKKDCINITGKDFNHDDSIPTSNLDEHFKTTQKLWKKHYNENYHVDGGMNRGEPPTEYYNSDWVLKYGDESLSSSTAATTILWCWQEEYNKMHMYEKDKSLVVGNNNSKTGDDECWIQYDESICKDVEKAFRLFQSGNGGGGVASSTSYTIPNSNYIIDFTRMKQININTEYERFVKRVQVIWCWEETSSLVSNHNPATIFGKDGTMIKYDDEISNQIEIAYQSQKGKGTFKLPIAGGNSYMIDFDSLKQVKKSTGYKRNVKREIVTLKNDEYTNVTAAVFSKSSADPVMTGMNKAAVSAATTKAYDTPIITDAVAISVGTTTTKQETAPPPKPADSSSSTGSNNITSKCLLLSLGAACIILVGGIILTLALVSGATEDTAVAATDFEQAFNEKNLSPSPTIISLPTRVATTPTPSSFTSANNPTFAPVDATGTTLLPTNPASIDSSNPYPGKRYLCGSIPPNSYYIEDRNNIPTCLRVEPVLNGAPYRTPERPLCMSGEESMDDPPMWCYQDSTVTSYERQSYYLWWSPCTTCGTAWRLDEERDDDKSMFKSPTELPTDSSLVSGMMPPRGYDWQRWTGSSWSNDVDMMVTPCDPEECWVDAEYNYDNADYDSNNDFYNPPSSDWNWDSDSDSDWYTNGSSSSNAESSSSFQGGAFIAIFVFGFVFIVIFGIACSTKGGGGASSGGGAGRSHHHHAVAHGGGHAFSGGGGAGCGGGGGGGGGGCGGGGGGCGGC